MLVLLKPESCNRERPLLLVAAGAADVHIPVDSDLRRITYSLKPGKVNDGFDWVVGFGFAKQSFDQRGIADVTAN